MPMVKFSSQVFRVLNEKKNDWENEKNDWGKCLGLPHTGYDPDCIVFVWLLKNSTLVLSFLVLNVCEVIWFQFLRSVDEILAVWAVLSCAIVYYVD